MPCTTGYGPLGTLLITLCDSFANHASLLKSWNPIFIVANRFSLLDGIREATMSHFNTALKRLQNLVCYINLIRDSVTEIFKYIYISSDSRDNATISAEMVNDGLEVTFGVEFECIFAFHESILQQRLHKIGDGSKIVKDLSEAARWDLNRSSIAYLLTRRRYMSWGLTGPTKYPLGSRELHFQDKNEENRSEHGCRPYGSEVLHLAESVLPSGVRIHDSWAQKCQDFTAWHLTHDTSLAGVDKPTLESHLANHTDVNINDWDSHGIELVTPVMPYTSSSFEEISSHLAPLTPQDSTHLAILSPHCGMHVHIGLPSPTQTFTLPTIQHLSYILLLYQPTLSPLFPPSRRPDSLTTNPDIASNTDAFIQEPPPLPPLPETFDPLTQDLDDEPPLPYPDPYDFASARRQIFSADMTLAKLVKLMCPSGKQHLVNLTYLCRFPDEPRTIEFRQHEGCLGPEGARWWIAVCVGLVRAAERMAERWGAGEGYQGEGYERREWREEAAEVEEVWDLIGLEKEGRRWFKGKVERWV